MRANKSDATVLVDPISVAKSVRVRAVLNEIDVLFPNTKEAAVLSGHAVATRDDIVEAAADLRRQGVGTVIMTLGEDGIYVDDGKPGRFIPAIPARKLTDVTGAGDALVAGYAYAMIAGERLRTGTLGPRGSQSDARNGRIDRAESGPPGRFSNESNQT